MRPHPRQNAFLLESTVRSIKARVYSRTAIVVVVMARLREADHCHLIAEADSFSWGAFRGRLAHPAVPRCRGASISIDQLPSRLCGCRRALACRLAPRRQFGS